MLYKRKGSEYWQIKFTLKGVTVRRSTGTADKETAKRVEQQARADVIESLLSGPRKACTWKEAQKIWRSAKVTKRSLHTDESIFRSTAIFNDHDVKEMTAEIIAQYGDIVVKRASVSTANRHLALIRSVLKLLVKRKILHEAPHVQEYELPEPEQRWIDPVHVRALMDALPAYARDIAEFAVLTGLRSANVRGLRWDWIRLDAGYLVIPATKAKGKRPIRIPLAPAALAILERRKGISAEYVFTGPKGRANGGKRLVSLQRPWNAAREATGLHDIRFHDLRHAWASYHMANGTPDRVLQTLGGWASPKMLQRYAHHKPGVLEQYAGNAGLALQSENSPKIP